MEKIKKIYSETSLHRDKRFGPCREFGFFQRLLPISVITLVFIMLVVAESQVALQRPFR